MFVLLHSIVACEALSLVQGSDAAIHVIVCLEVDVALIHASLDQFDAAEITSDSGLFSIF